MAPRNSRGGGGKDRPFVFPSLKVDGELWNQEVVIPNTGQGVLAAQQEAAQLIRKRRAAMAAAEAAVPTGEDSPESTVPTGGDSQAVSGADLVDVSQVLSPKQVNGIREWLAENLPTADQLFHAAAAMVGLQGVENRVSDLVIRFKEDLDAFKAAFSSWFDGVQQNWAEMVARGEATLQQWADQIAEVSRWRDDLEQRLFAAIADKRGPKGDLGNTGMAGTATTVVDRLPKGKGADFLFPYIGRDAIVGDIAIDGTTDMRYAWRWTGQAWERGPAMVTLQVRDVKVASVMGAPQYTTQVIQKQGGGGGSGGEHLIANRLLLNSDTPVSDSSNWAGISDPLSGTIELDIRPLDGSYAGQSSVCVASFSWEASGDRWTEYALNGSLFNVFNINLRIQRSFAVAPAAYTGTLPSAARRLVVIAQPVLAPGASAGGTTRFSLAGSVEYNRESEAKIYLPTDKTPEPLWHWG